MAFPFELSADMFIRTFFEICSDRYPSSSKVMAATEKRFPGLSTRQKIIIINKFRDAVRALAPSHIYRSIQHRDDVFMAIIEALEDLEDKLEEEESLAAEKEND